MQFLISLKKFILPKNNTKQFIGTHIVIIEPHTSSTQRLSLMSTALHIWSTIMLFMSACINPIIYVIMNKQYRQAYKTVLTCQRPRMISTTPGPGSSYGGMYFSDSTILQYVPGVLFKCWGILAVVNSNNYYS